MEKEKERVYDMVKIITSEDTYEGMVMPSADNKKVVLKLPSGYNVGVEKKNIKKMSTVKKFSGSIAKRESNRDKEPKEKIITDKHLPTIAILHTGGTVASQVDYATGAVTPRFTPEDLMRWFQELREYAIVTSRLVRNMWSQEMRFQHYNILANAIQKEIKEGVDGIIVTHGTDTLAYTATALAFILEDLPIPVLLVGSQRSSDRGSSDAYMNMICAVQFVTKSDFGDVGVCMHETSADDTCVILPACKTRKLHSSRRDAFKVVNGEPYARINRAGTIEFLNRTYKKKDNKRKLKLKLFNKKIKVGVVKQHTHMFADQFSLYEKYQGLVIEAPGLGNLPITKVDEYTRENAKIFNTIKKLVKKGVVVTVVPQTIYGRVNMNVYENGRRQQDIGVLGNFSDMLVETTFLKLAWLLSNYKKNEVKKLLGENLRGELTKRSDMLEYE